MKQKSFDLHKLYKEETDWESKSTANLNYFSSSEQNSSPKGRGSSRWSITPRPRPLVKVCSQVPSWISEPLGFGYSYQTPPLSPAFLSLLSLSFLKEGSFIVMLYQTPVVWEEGLAPSSFQIYKSWGILFEIPHPRCFICTETWLRWQSLNLSIVMGWIFSTF